MKIKGDSERGNVNSHFYELKYFEDRNKIFDKFIFLIEFQKYHQDLKITVASIYLEQSFSDFRRADMGTDLLRNH